jgi:hypothetical protein
MDLAGIPYPLTFPCEPAVLGWPNDLGNYARREKRPAPTPLTPDERFARLKASYQASAEEIKKRRRRLPS